MKKLAVFFIFSLILLTAAGCQKYDPVETMKATVRVSVYFSPDPHGALYDWYKGKKPDPGKHRQVVYEVTVTNTGKKDKSFILVEPILDPSFKKVIINKTFGLPGYVPPDQTVTLDRIFYLAEGDPAEIERLAYRTKLRIVWEEGGKKWEKVVGVTPGR